MKHRVSLQAALQVPDPRPRPSIQPCLHPRRVDDSVTTQGPQLSAPLRTEPQNEGGGQCMWRVSQGTLVSLRIPRHKHSGPGSGQNGAPGPQHG